MKVRLPQGQDVCLLPLDQDMCLRYTLPKVHTNQNRQCARKGNRQMLNNLLQSLQKVSHVLVHTVFLLGVCSYFCIQLLSELATSGYKCINILIGKLGIFWQAHTLENAFPFNRLQFAKQFRSAKIHYKGKKHLQILFWKDYF